MNEQLTDSAVKRPQEFIPDWFKMSPGISWNVDACGLKFIWGYVMGVKSKKLSYKLFRHQTSFNAGRIDMFRSNSNILKTTDESKVINETISVVFRSQAKHLAEQAGRSASDLSTFFSPGVNIFNGEIEKVFEDNYDFPKSKWKSVNFTQLFQMCISAATMIYRYMDSIGLGNIAITPSLGTAINSPWFFPHIVDGEILDETFGAPTITRCFIPFVDKNLNVYRLKISDKVSDAGKNPALTDEYLDCFGAAIRNTSGLSSMLGTLKIFILDKKGDIAGAEEHSKVITKYDMDEIIRKHSIQAKQIKSMQLTAKKGWLCKMCDFEGVCINKDPSGYVCDSLKAIKTEEAGEGDEFF
jgi:hypothetical protein